MKLNNNYTIKHILDSDILINIKDDFNGVIKLNKTSKDIIDGINNNLSVDEIINNLKDKYDVDSNELDKDVHKFIDELISKGILINE